MYHLYKDTRRLDLWYPLEELKQEIGMRTAYLGKLRSSEQAEHLLDLIHMTDDEENLLMSFANNAMAEVYECFSKYARHLHVPTMVLNDGELNTVKTQAIPEITAGNVPIPLPTISGNNIHVHLTGVEANEAFDKSKYGILLNCTLTYTTAYTILETGTKVPQETVSIPISVAATENALLGSYSANIDYQVKLSSGTDILSASFIDSSSVRIDSVELYTLSPETISEFGWVEYDNKLWFSLVEVDEDTFIHTMMGRRENRCEFILYPVDPRYSIRYYIEYVKELSMHYIHPLDIAIKEALVCYIIAHWLEYAYPNEYDRWHIKYQKALLDVRKRCNVQEKPIKKLIPRWF